MSGERIDWAWSNEQLASLVTELPDGTDLGMHAMSDLLVGRNGVSRDPARYSQIYSIAAEGATTDWMRLACRIQECNGARRMGDVDLRRVTNELEDITRAVLQLPTGPHQQALGGELAYHYGIVFRGLRNYLAASRVQLASSLWLSAAGQHEKARVAIFVAAVEDMSAALIEGNITAIAQAFHHLHQIRKIVRATCDPYPRWMQENAAIHVWWAYLMAGMLIVGTGYFEEDDDREEIEATIFPHWKLVYDVVTEATTARAALEQLRDLPSSSIGNAFLTIKLLQAERLTGPKRHTLLEEVAAWDGPDGGVPIAIAKFKLASMA